VRNLGAGFVEPGLVMSTRYTLSDGKLVLSLELAEARGDVVTSLLDPELITQADTIEEGLPTPATPRKL